MEKRRFTFTSVFVGIGLVLEALDLIFYGTFGFVVLAASVRELAEAAMKVSLLLVAVGALLLVTLFAACIRDIIRRRWSLASKGLLIAWVVCSLYVLVIVG